MKKSQNLVLRQLKELKTKGYFERARERAKRRKSPWNFILIPLGLGFMIFFTYASFKLMWSVHTYFYPEHIGELHNFWRKGISGRAFASSFLMLIPSLLGSIPLGLVCANLVAWCIPPARRTFEYEAKGHKGTSFKQFMPGMAKFSLIFALFCISLSFIGAVTLVNLK